MTLSTIPNSARPVRRPGRPPSGKRLNNASRELSGKVRSAYRRGLDPCDNSNDSGLGYEHHIDHQQHPISLSERLTWSAERAEVKRPRLDIKLENDDINESYSFPDAIRSCKDNISLIRTAPAGSVPHLTTNTNSCSSSGRAVPRCLPLSNRQSSSSPVPLTTQLSNSSRFMDVSLTIVKQPEQQHRARYQTEGSRGAVKDRDGNGFPVVRLTGYYKPATLQVFIGTDVGKVAPHMFYQACKVSGKNSTPCIEKKIDGTCVIELQLDPSKEMSATCDCVGILKERNVDVEHRFPDQLGNRSKKKSTKCRMIFRTTITLDNGTQETLQVCSQPIVCTQPPGVPEICKKSLTSCPASGGLELFVLGKNFLKDTKVYFQQSEDGHIRWEQVVTPDKEYLQQTHFVCVVPPYRRSDITEPVSVKLCVFSSGKTSEYHQFVYTPINGVMPSVQMDTTPSLQSTSNTLQSTPSTPFFKSVWQQQQQQPSISKREQDLDMMPPPDSNLVPLTRRSSISVPSTSEMHSPPLRTTPTTTTTLKQEYIDENSQNSLDQDIVRYRHISESSLDVHHGDSNMSIINENSMDLQSNNIVSHENSNLSIDDSVDVVIRRNSFNGGRHHICENSNLSVNEDSGTILPSAFHQIQQQTALVPPKVIDLRMKQQQATVADLANSTAPSMAALQRFGMMGPQVEPLVPQSVQSVENYLTKIEQKPTDAIKTTTVDDLCILQTTKSMIETTEPVFIHSQPQFTSRTTSDPVDIVAKSEAAAIAEQSLPEQTMASTTTLTTIAATLDNGIPTPINTEKLDDLVNSTVESHIGSPTDSSASPKSDKLITSQDVMLNSQNALLVPPININTTLPSPTTDAILNTQISPSLMCRSSTDLLPNVASSICQGPLLSSTSAAPQPTATVGFTSESEKAVLFEAAVDLLQTQKKMAELGAITTTKPTISQLSTNTASNFNLLMPKTTASVIKTDFDIPVPVKEIANAEKKTDDTTMISLSSLSENELINLINPSCFDQGNTANYQ